MYIEKLYLRHFRNYQEEVFSFSPEMNLIRGPNAQGKTNLLEALFLIGTGRSFRTSHLKELIGESAPYFLVEAQLMKDGVRQKVRLSFDGESKKLEMNGSSYVHFHPLLGFLPIVLLAPEDVFLITGAPADRRKFLDLHLAQSDSSYIFHLTRYHQAMKHRNLLLKNNREEGMHAWESLMVSEAYHLKKKREECIDELREDLMMYMQLLSKEKDRIEINYCPSFTDNYLSSRPKELILGSTLCGPHRDEVKFLINGFSAKAHASQGQLRSAMAALRLAQWKHFFSKHKKAPLFCIDDFAVHLDEERSEVFLSYLASCGASCGQVFLTSCLLGGSGNHHTLHIESGKVRGDQLPNID